MNGHASDIFCLVLLKNGNLVSGSLDETIKIWNLKNGLCVCTLTGHDDAITSLELKNTGELISVSVDGIIKIWNLEDKVWIKTLSSDIKNSMEFIISFQDSIITNDDNAIKAIHLESQESIKKIEGRHAIKCLIII